MSNELAIPNDPFTVYHDDDWQPIANIFNTYKKQFELELEHAEDCLGLATEWRKFQSTPPEDPQTIDLFFNLLSSSLKQYNLLPDLRTNIPANIDEIISSLNNISYNYKHHFIKNQTDAIDATRRFARACAILQDLHAHGVSTHTPESYLKKLKDNIELISSDFQAYEDEPNFQEGTAIELAEAFCRGTDQIENWLLQHVYMCTCYHNRLAPTIDTNSISKKFDDIKSSILGVSSKLDETNAAAKSAAAQAAKAQVAADKANTTAKLTREDVQVGNAANKNGIAVLVTGQHNIFDQVHDLNEVNSASAADAPILDPNKKIESNLSPEKAEAILYDYLEEHDALQYMVCAKTIRRWLKKGKVPGLNLLFPPSALTNEQTLKFWCAKYKWQCDHHKRVKGKKDNPYSDIKVNPKTGNLVVE